ncbi:peptidoglycan bridge formation glycyltransferase FemA/FemB family protein [Candidatus Azambacteria bacterium]|nr:peptidoglycan bridge formation glycyltransferase FemA/FemB family protein [Candidatus Azambacteria bacterium]
MKIELISKNDKNTFDAFVLKNNSSSLQSFEWGEFQESFNRDVLRYFVKENGKIILSASVLVYSLPFKKKYFYIPYGPVVSSEAGAEKINEAFSMLIADLKIKAKKEKAIFLKVEQEYPKIDLLDLGFKKSEKDVQARETLILDISKPEDELLRDMKQKTRYNIKVAQKHNVKIFEIANKAAAFDMFYKILAETSKRNGFRLHPKRYYENMVDMFFSHDSGSSRNAISGVLTEAQPSSPDGELGVSAQKKEYSEKSRPELKERIFFAECEGKIIASALVGIFGKRATFLHGASSDEHKNVMAPYLLHWEIAKKMKALGCSEYDFWGIVTEKTDPKKREQWEGFSRFKMGFGGDIFEYQGAYDLSLQKLWHLAYKIARKFS